ncbi:DUF4112 domain-containing protein [Parvularcula sp. LCG005]|uniref:DUF4112 domain-containing protein n=1 Tax=Parvularcula sp. LCG005 TaxID=3078805 RepID=UPI002941E7E6|nr:DUF4112 domain-containing protein [Parvularcula sp. LCG005]WOI54785.1 DUF4112 domain-containing protein [Parvularcula sp. LCG005]
MPESTTTSMIEPNDSRDTIARKLERSRALSLALDTRFRVFGFSFGWDAIIGLIPGVGDAITGIMSSYIVAEAWRAGAPFSLLLRMAFNIALDTIVGVVPILGGIFDIWFKANVKNTRLFHRYLERQLEAHESDGKVRPVRHARRIESSSSRQQIDASLR